MTYDQFVQSMQTLLVVPLNNSDTNFQLILPRAIEYGELRIYRELDFLCTLAAQTSTLTSGNRSVTLPPSVVVLEAMNVITPVTATSGDAGTRNPLQRVSPEFLDAVYPTAATTGSPKWYAMISSAPTVTSVTTVSPTAPYTVRLGPSPDAAYTAEFLGTVRPAALSKANPSTFISVNLPDLFIAACMIFASGYQRDFGTQSADPNAAMSWSKTYSDLRDGLNIESLRQKAKSSEWTAIMPSQAANQPLNRVG